ncbi:MAG: Nramp family divalent metal transporter [Bryobacteraceae bacterium]|jgi:manganese transport protein
MSRTNEQSWSLPEVHGSVGVSQHSIWRRMFAFAGPAYLVSVGYMDPGNWATDLEGGARFGYQLLWVLVMSNLMAILLQTLSARLGIASNRDLAQACRESYPRPVNLTLWALCEIAIAACDLAEVLGAAIGLNLLFGLPLLPGVLITALDSLLLLWLSRFGIRVIESFVLALITVMGGCFFVEIVMARPVFSEIATGLIPRLTNQSLYVAIGILGATVMPHNLYLHSALVQTRRIGESHSEKTTACRFNLVDSLVALNGAMLVNVAILILAGAVFFKNHLVVTEIKQASHLLTPLLGTALASVLFAVALMCSGLSSTMTGTMAGQIVMEGFLSIRMRPWLRRLTTRLAAITPAVLTIYIAGEQGTYQLLILSQVILSLQLPFAVVPLIHFTSDRRRMGAFANSGWVRLLAWLVAVIIVGLNIRLAWLAVSEWLEAAGGYRLLLVFTVIPLLAGLLALLLWITLQPWLPRWRMKRREAVALPEPTGGGLAVPVYRTILVPLDHSARDRAAIAHAAGMARLHNAKLYLLHIEEDATSQVYGPLASTAEVEAGARYLDDILESLRAQGIQVEVAVGYSRDPKEEIVRFARQIKPDLVVMGAHGHRGIQDLVFGQTINGVRHALDTPILIVRDE